MTKEDILHHFQDINFYYNDCMMYDDLSRMLDELIDEIKNEMHFDNRTCSNCKFVSLHCDHDVAACDCCSNWEDDNQ